MSEPPKQKPWVVQAREPGSGPPSASAPPVISRVDRVRRPLGITVISILNFVLAALFLVVIVLSLTSTSSRDSAVVWVAILPVVISVGLGIALWRMMSWARNTAIVLYLVYAASALLNIISREITFAGIASILIPAAIVLYLLQPSVRDAFESTRPANG
jgi:hypothetical protein